MLSRLVTVVQALTAVAVIVFVVMLFANSPTEPPPAEASVDDSFPTIDAADLYGRNCAGCHGGDGSGGIGPPLISARIIDRFPDPADQAFVVTNGRGGMPAFGSRLTAEEIDAIVNYTRTSL